MLHEAWITAWLSAPIVTVHTVSSALTSSAASTSPTASTSKTVCLSLGPKYFHNTAFTSPSLQRTAAVPTLPSIADPSENTMTSDLAEDMASIALALDLGTWIGN